jgi:protein involved in polysaccharide export with SLBB domain
MKRLAPYLLIWLLFYGCASAPKQEVVSIPLNPPKQTVYYLQTGDKIEVKFFYYPEMNETLEIRPDGRISLQLLGEIQAAGLTPSQLTKILRAKYAKYLAKPEVVVVVKEFAGEKVYVGGEVNKPGEIPIKGRLTLLQAVFQAGGLTEKAKPSDVLILHPAGNRLEVVKIDLNAILEQKQGDVFLGPYDVVYVPQTTIAKIDQFINQYINAIIPKSLSFPFVYQLSRSKGSTIVIGGQ